jgi:hypothetical protein
MILAHQEGVIFWSLPWLFLPMEGIECLSLTDDGFNVDPVLSYMPEQLYHHEVVPALLANPLTEDIERQIWSCWHQNEMFHIDTIHRLGLEARAQVGSNLLLIVVDTSQSVTTLTPRVQPLTQTVTIDDIMPFLVLVSRDVEVSLMSMQVLLTLQIPISGLTLGSSSPRT